MSEQELSEDEERMLVLLERSHSFPGPYTFKLIFRSSPGLEAELTRRICSGAGLEEPESPPALRTSAAGRFSSMTLELRMDGAQDVLTVYRIIGEQDEVVSYF